MPSWVDAFSAFTEKTGSPSLFRKWAAIYTIAAAMERKTWVRTARRIMYPNMYVILVGPAGAGKGLATNEAYDLIAELEDHHIAPSNVSKASLIDALAEAERKIVRPQDVPPVITFHSLAVYSNELGTLIPAYENDFINTITDLWDCKRYDEKKRTGKLEIHLPAPQLNFLAATTPSYLNQLLPEGAWDQGFIARTTLVYSGPGPDIDLFEEVEEDTVMRNALIEDLRKVGNLYGAFSFTEEAVAAFRHWAAAKYEPRPTHPKLAFYNSRRPSHLLKLCMVASASTSNDLIITLDNYAEAFSWLLEVEKAMEDIFKSMQTGGATRVIDETWYWAYDWWLRHKRERPIPESMLWEYVAARAPVGDVPRIIETMIKTGILTEKLAAGVGKVYEVKGRK